MMWRKVIVAIGLTFAFCDAVGADEVFVGAGDIALCTRANDEAVANLLDTIPGTIFTLGDNAYPKATAQQLTQCYGPSWGRHKSRTRPAIGNHEYMSPGAQPYLEYFGVSKNYAYDLGDWHIVSFDSNCQLAENGGSCGPKSVAMQWLKSELALNSKPCTLVYFHHPRWSSNAAHGNTTRMSAAWKIMYDAGVDVVLSGHAHAYERFAPLSPTGTVDSLRGIRSFVVGTGGAGLTRFNQPVNGSEARNSATFGVLKLVLGTVNYTWEFVPASGGTFTDSGSADCH